MAPYLADDAALLAENCCALRATKTVAARGATLTRTAGL